MSVDASDCPNCYTDNDDETDCPHLVEGDNCPNCGDKLVKPRWGKVKCPGCEYVVNGNNEYILDEFNITLRESKRLLKTFGYDTPRTTTDCVSLLQKLCSDNDIHPEELNGLIDDLRDSNEDSDEEQGNDTGFIKSWAEAQKKKASRDYRDYESGSFEQGTVVGRKDAMNDLIQLILKTDSED